RSRPQLRRIAQPFRTASESRSASKLERDVDHERAVVGGGRGAGDVGRAGGADDHAVAAVGEVAGEHEVEGGVTLDVAGHVEGADERAVEGAGRDTLERQ